MDKIQRLLVLVGITVLSVMLASSWVLAQSPDPQSPAMGDSPRAPVGYGDDGILEVGVEWINDFPGTADDRSHWDESCDRLYNKLRNDGWTGRFRFTDWSAWERDFKKASAGGNEETYPDSADIVMLCTHGSSTWDSFWDKNLSSVYFGSTHDDHHLVPGDAYNVYGDKDMEWLAFDSCSVLRDGTGTPYPDRSYWAATMDGLHLLLGFGNTMYVISEGDGSRWADYMLGYRWCLFGSCFWIRPPYKVAQAWFEATDDLQPGGVCARVLAERSEQFNDYLWGKGWVSSDTPTDNIYHWQQHCSCTPPARQLDQGLLADIATLPVYEVVQRTIDVNYVQEIGEVFGMSETEVFTETDYYFMLQNTGVETYSLQVDRVTGGYKYRNMSELWAAPVETPTLLSEREALAQGNKFFTGEGEGLPGAAYHTGAHLFMVEEEVTTQKLSPAMLGTQAVEQEVNRMPLHTSLSYGRVLDVAVGVKTTLGRLQVQQEQLSVVGPGARTKLYLGDLGSMLGAQGGSRDLQTTGESVTIMDANKVWDMYVTTPTLALAQIPWDYDVVTRTGETLGYYEQPHVYEQLQLIPSWIFSATFAAGGEILAENVFVYMPAAAEYLPPVVHVTAPTEGMVFEASEMVSLQGEVVQYGKEPFVYIWTSNYGGVLGTGKALNVQLSAALVKSDAISHTISLEVTDANGQQGSASVMVFVKPMVYLPLVLKD
ncbi:MAG: hypothetical protein JXA33_11715 [Anaerolineae bacterium]|nr:hypothetical protein [Anaerolineae bacterium]